VLDGEKKSCAVNAMHERTVSATSQQAALCAARQWPAL